MEKLILKNITKENTKEICEKYQINVCEVELGNGEQLKVWCCDGDFGQLLIDSNIKVGNTYDREKEFDFDDDYQPIGLDYNDYIETLELIQDGESYYYPIFCAYNGTGAEDAIAIFNPTTV